MTEAVVDVRLCDFSNMVRTDMNCIVSEVAMLRPVAGPAACWHGSQHNLFQPAFTNAQ